MGKEITIPTVNLWELMNVDFKIYLTVKKFPKWMKETVSVVDLVTFLENNCLAVLNALLTLDKLLKMKEMVKMVKTEEVVEEVLEEALEEMEETEVPVLILLLLFLPLLHS